MWYQHEVIMQTTTDNGKESDKKDKSKTDPTCTFEHEICEVPHQAGNVGKEASDIHEHLLEEHNTEEQPLLDKGKKSEETHAAEDESKTKPSCMDNLDCTEDNKSEENEEEKASSIDNIEVSQAEWEEKLAIATLENKKLKKEWHDQLKLKMASRRRRWA